MVMSYCSSCGSYMPDWAEECPACGAAKSGPKKQRASQAKGGAASAASAAEPKKEEKPAPSQGLTMPSFQVPRSTGAPTTSNIPKKDIQIPDFLKRR